MHVKQRNTPLALSLELHVLLGVGDTHTCTCISVASWLRGKCKFFFSFHSFFFMSIIWTCNQKVLPWSLQKYPFPLSRSQDLPFLTLPSLPPQTHPSTLRLFGPRWNINVIIALLLMHALDDVKLLTRVLSDVTHAMWVLRFHDVIPTCVFSDVTQAMCVLRWRNTHVHLMSGLSTGSPSDEINASFGSGQCLLFGYLGHGQFSVVAAGQL
jgi:hypothetical protein